MAVEMWQYPYALRSAAVPLVTLDHQEASIRASADPEGDFAAPPARILRLPLNQGTPHAIVVWAKHLLCGEADREELAAAFGQEQTGGVSGSGMDTDMDTDTGGIAGINRHPPHVVSTGALSLDARAMVRTCKQHVHLLPPELTSAVTARQARGEEVVLVVAFSLEPNIEDHEEYTIEFSIAEE
jgi:hypothetical protein